MTSTRSDIYSLGVLLYELLTGSTPFDKERLSKAGYDELRRIIREEEPARPSTRLSTMGAEATVVSTRRQSSPKQLSRLFRGELDWIVMKALEKDRSRRYETAAAFAGDIRRYLRDEPVSACPPSNWYRLGKMARRYKGALVTAVLVSAALVAGTVISVWQAIVATDAVNSERQALTNLEQEQKATQRELRRTRDAETEARLELFEARLAQARANRLSRRLGQRFNTLELLRKAVGMARQLNLPPGRFVEMRNEAIAALVLPDLCVAKEWPEASAYKVHFDAKFERYARTDRAGNVQVRSAGDGKEIYRLPSVAPGESDPMLSPDGSYLSVWAAGRVRVWKLAEANPLPVLNRPALGPACFSPDSRQLAMQVADGSISLFDLATSTRVRQLPKAPRVYFFAFHPGGAQLALACYTSVQLRDLQTGEVLWEKNDLTGYAYRPVGWHPEGKILAMGDGRAIALWDVTKDQQVSSLETNMAAGTTFTFNPAGTLLASTGWDGMLRLWDPLTGRQIFSTHTEIRTPAPQFSADGRFLAATQHDKKLRIWEFDAATEYRTLIASPLKGKRPYGSVAISPDGRFLAGGADAAFALWDLSTGKELAYQDGAPFTGVAFERGSRPESGAEKQEATLLSMGADGLLRWPIRAEPLTGAIDLGPPEKLACPTANCRIAQSDDGRVRAFPHRSQGAFVQDMDQPGKIFRLEPFHQDVRHVAVSPDGRWIAAGRWSYPGGVKIWERGKGAANGLTYKFVKDFPYGTMVVFSSDSKRLVAITGGWIAPMRRWELASWAEMPFKEPVESITAGFTPDGKLLVLGTGSGITRLLDADTDQEYARLEDPDQHSTECFAFTPDGTKLVCASGRSGYCVHVCNLKEIRRELHLMGLDWN